MVSFDGESCLYDENGNPEIYRGEDFAWLNSGLLYRCHNKEFFYDATGRRVRKTIPGGHNPIIYLYAGDKLIAEKENGAVTKRYFYDGMGIAGMEYGGNKYYFRKNLQGDVTEIYDESANQVGSYVYDAWGKILSMQGEMAEINPFRYRGYYYDVETDFYYLQSRYYDPETGRFLNSDAYSYLSPETLNGLNLYVYCGNNPVMHVDSTGHFWDTILDIGFIIWSIVDLVNDGWKDWKNWVALGVDLVFAAIPFIPSGLGQVIKVGNKIDNANDVVSAINKIDNVQDLSKVTMIGRDMHRVQNTADLIGISDNLYVMWKGYDKGAKGLRKGINHFLSMAHNGCWLFGKLRTGYTVIDIGITTAHKGIKTWGLWYSTERIVLALWGTRNIWKLFLNYYL